ncbi:MAG: hypothetical protein WKF43_04670 [Acidimicrobiales bacterium]
MVARRYVRSVLLAIVSGVGAGVLVAGAGGRLAMRLLAATAGDGAQGRLTEADERIGEISTGGTIGFVLFTAIFFGVLGGTAFMVLRRWLPPGRVGGMVYGLLLLVVLAPALDPLRRGNPDFDLVGPGWLALLVFGALTVAYGMAVAAIAARYSQWLPTLSTSPRAVIGHAPLLLFVPAFVAAVPVLLVGIVVVGLAGVPAVADRLQRPAAMVIGRAVLIVVAAVALPRFVATVVDIAGRGPA